MTLLEIKTAAANYLQKSVAELTVNGLDMGLVAMNQARRLAELSYDFEFSRQLLTLTIDGVTGGSLTNAVLQGTTTPAEIKTMVEVGVFDARGNFHAVEWTTVAEGIERQRQERNSQFFNYWNRYPTDDLSQQSFRRRFMFSGDRVVPYPVCAENANQTYNLGFEAYTFTSDWTSPQLGSGSTIATRTVDPHVEGQFWNNGGVIMTSLPPFTGSGVPDSDIFGVGVALQTTDPHIDGAFWNNGGVIMTSFAPFTGSSSAYSDVWTTHGQQFLLWQTIVQLNYMIKEFVVRQEGNLAPPQAMADMGLEQLKQYDLFKYEQFRRHER